MSQPLVIDAHSNPAPVALGSLLFTLVEPHRGHEVAYNRWYERDHFYAGCMIGPWLYAGRRFVATSRLKALREPQTPGASPVFSDVKLGSYLALYFVAAGRHDEHFDWAVEQVNWLHANDRMFEQRDHIHTLLYEHEWSLQRDPEGVPPELALSHPYRGLAVEMLDPAEGHTRAELHTWLQQESLPKRLAGSPIALSIAFKACALSDDAPADVPRIPGMEERTLLLHFLERDPSEEWAQRFASPGGSAGEASPATRVFAAPFVPTVPGTDRYTDELWPA